MPRSPRRRGARKHHHAHHAIALATGCADCAAEELRDPKPVGNPVVPGFMGVVHYHDALELERKGWVLTTYLSGEPPDVTCVHYHEANWMGD